MAWGQAGQPQHVESTSGELWDAHVQRKHEKSLLLVLPKRKTKKSREPAARIHGS